TSVAGARPAPCDGVGSDPCAGGRAVGVPAVVVVAHSVTPAQNRGQVAVPGARARTSPTPSSSRAGAARPGASASSARPDHGVPGAGATPCTGTPATARPTLPGAPQAAAVPAATAAAA